MMCILIAHPHISIHLTPKACVFPSLCKLCSLTCREMWVTNSNQHTSDNQKAIQTRQSACPYWCIESVTPPCTVAIVYWASKETSLLQNDAHKDPRHQNQSYLDTDIKSYSSPYEAHLKNQRLLLSKERKCGDVANGNFSKNHRNCLWEPPWKATYSEHSIAIHSISKAGYATAVLFVVHEELRAREVSSFCDFWKFTSCDFNFNLNFTLFLLLKANIWFLRCAW